MKDPLQSDHCAEMLRALAEPLRLRIVDCLRSGPQSVGELSKLLEVEVVNVSHHLAVLRKAGLVESKRKGRFIVYRLPNGICPCDNGSPMIDHIDLGCCRLEIPKDNT